MRQALTYWSRGYIAPPEPDTPTEDVLYEDDTNILYEDSDTLYYLIE